MLSAVLPPAPVIDAVWGALTPLRRFHHRGRCCPMPTDLRPGACEPCYDLLVDALERLRTRTDAPTPALARVVVRQFGVDALRRANAAAHAVAKPERRDGVPGRIAARLRTLPDGPWLDTLLTLVLRAAGARTPLPRDTWPWETFAEQRAAVLAPASTTVHLRQVRREVALVLHVAAEVAGPRWVDDYVHAPMRARAVGPVEPLLDPAGPTSEDGTLTEAFWSRMRGDAVAALRDAVREVTGADAAPGALWPVAVGMVADLPALSAAARRDRPTVTAADVQAAVTARTADPRAGARLDPRLVAAVRAELDRVPLDRLAPRR